MENLQTLAMVLVDYDYAYDPTRRGTEPPAPFEVDETFYASDIEEQGWAIRLSLGSIGDYVMLLYIDIYGNEYTEIKSPSDFVKGSIEVDARPTAIS
jgi:hypothetical protein